MNWRLTNLNTDTHFVTKCGHMDNREGTGRVMCVHHDSQAIAQLRPWVLGCQLSITTMLYHNSIIDSCYKGINILYHQARNLLLLKFNIKYLDRYNTDNWFIEVHCIFLTQSLYSNIRAYWGLAFWIRLRYVMISLVMVWIIPVHYWWELSEMNGTISESKCLDKCWRCVLHRRTCN